MESRFSGNAAGLKKLTGYFISHNFLNNGTNSNPLMAMTQTLNHPVNSGGEYPIRKISFHAWAENNPR